MEADPTKNYKLIESLDELTEVALKHSIYMVPIDYIDSPLEALNSLSQHVVYESSLRTINNMVKGKQFYYEEKAAPVDPVRQVDITLSFNKFKLKT